jgi:WD40 repeat protein
VNCVALGSGVVVSGGDDATVRVWNLQTLKEDAVLEGHKGWFCDVQRARPPHHAARLT